MKSSAALILLLAGFAPGCRREASLTLPDAPTAKTLLLARFQDHAECGAANGFDLLVFSPPSAFSEAAPIASEEADHLVALYYRHPPAVLGLPNSGPLNCEGSGSPLPTPDLVFSSTVSGAGPEAWAPAAEIPNPIAALRFQLATFTSTAPCAASLRPSSIPLPGSTSGAKAMVLMGDGTVFAATDAARFYRVSRAGATLLAAAATSTPTAAYRAPDGAIWVALLGGAILELAPDGQSVRSRFSAPLPRVDSLDGPRDASTPFELFAGGRSGVLARLDPSSGRWDRASVSACHCGGKVVWLGPQEALWVLAQSGLVSHLKGGAVTTSTPAGVTGITAARWIPGLGPVLVVLIANAARELYNFDPTANAWVPYAETSVNSEQISDLVPFEGGIAFTGQHGIVGQIADPTRNCPLITSFSVDSVDTILSPAPDQLVLDADNDHGVPSLRWLAPN
jgi:hypothetical protein